MRVVLHSVYIAIAILIVLVFLYVSRIVPVGAASLIGAILTVATGLIPIEDAFAQFTGDVVLLLIGVMIIGQTFFEVGLADDLGRFISKKFASKEKIFLITILFVAIVLAAFISNTATVALMLPIIAAADRSSNGRINKKYYYMATGFASVLGGNITLFGSTPQVAVQSILLASENSGVRGLGVFELAKTAIPLALLLPLFYYIVGDKLQKRVINTNTNNEEQEQNKNTKYENKAISKKIIVCLIYAGCIIGFVGAWTSIGVTAIIGAVLCVCTRCIDEKVALKSVGWSTIVMLGGILTFSAGFSKCGAGQYIVDSIIALAGGSLSAYALYGILILLAVILTSVMSNTAVAAMLTPIGLSMANSVSANPMTFVVGIILASNISFCTPIATPPVAMTMTAGYKFSDYFIVGGLFTIVATIYVLLAVPIVYSF